MGSLSRRRLAYVELHFAVFLFGTAGLFGKLISAAPLAIVLGRSAIAAVTIAIVLRLFGIRFIKIPAHTVVLMLLSGVMLALHWLTFFYAIQVSTVAIGLLGYATFPVFVTFLEPLVYRQRLRGIDIVTALLVVAGLILVAPSFEFNDPGTAGLLWAVLSGALFAVLALLNRHIVAAQPAMIVSFVQHGTAALFLLPFFLASGVTPDSDTLWLLLVLGIVCTALPHTLYIKSLEQVKAQLASVVLGLEPVYGIVLAAVFLAEIPGLSTLLGAALILGAVVVAARAHASTDSSNSVP